MNDSRTFRLLGPITVGSALVGVSFCLRSDGLSEDRAAQRDAPQFTLNATRISPLATPHFALPIERSAADYAFVDDGLPFAAKAYRTGMHRSASAATRGSGASRNAEPGRQAKAPVDAEPVRLPEVSFGPSQRIQMPGLDDEAASLTVELEDTPSTEITGSGVSSISRAFTANIAPERQAIIPALKGFSRNTEAASGSTEASPIEAPAFEAAEEPVGQGRGLEGRSSLTIAEPVSSLSTRFRVSTDLAIPLPAPAEIAVAGEPVAVVDDSGSAILPEPEFANPEPVSFRATTALPTTANNDRENSGSDAVDSIRPASSIEVISTAAIKTTVSAEPTVLAIAAPFAASSAAPGAAPNLQDFPLSESEPLFDYDDELILQVRVEGTTATETIIAYGTRQGVYLPLGELSRLLDLAIRISDDGNYASGWFLSEERTITVDLRQGLLTTVEGPRDLPGGLAQAFDGELFLRADAFSMLFPLELEPDLRSQAINLKTLEPFPFEERIKRRADRNRLNSLGNARTTETWPREETPWLLVSAPIADIELRGVSDSSRGTRAEGDIRLAGDLLWMTGQAYLSGSSRDGLTTALLELGRRDPDGDLLGPLQATEFQLGDVSTRPMPLGLRGVSGRGAFVSNQPLESVSVFDQVDLRGVLPDGYEVELYRNDILLGSTREAVNGQYEFLQIPVDYGLNIFRLVFYGPQGQRREEVSRISVGDGRLSPGQLVYSAGAVERGVNLLGVTGPDFRRDDRYGDLQGIAELAYGINRDLTAISSAAFFENEGEQKWLLTTGLRTGIGALALRADAGISDANGKALGVGLGGRALGGSFKISHFEYRGEFVDEVRSIGSQPLRRATELDYNAALNLGATISIPLSLRAKHLEYDDGRRQTTASLRNSVRFPGLIASNTVSYASFSSPGGTGFTQISGNIDISTLGRSRAQVRGSLGYRITPDTRITQVGVEVNYAINDRTVVRGAAAYAFDDGDVAIGVSGIRKFDRFTAALDGQYAFGNDTYSLALRIGFSLGRDPLRGRIFAAPPGLASSGAVAVRAFQDLDGDGLLGPDDTPLADVNVSTSNRTAVTGAEGFARLGELGSGNRAVIQVDPSSLPDILMAPVSRGIEIVPRPGRFHIADFPIVALSEIEGTVTFAEADSARGVSGLRLQLVGEDGEAKNVVRTERGGYFFFERIKPGIYSLVIDPEQAELLNVCLATAQTIDVPATGDILQRDMTVSTCSPP